MILLEKYIKEFLKEAASSAIINPAQNITGETQHQQAASYSLNMTNVDHEETLLKVLENVGDNCFISFVDEYDENIPRLEISPKVSFDTPHGNYAYPLNISSLKEIVEKSKIRGTSFALNRPYFHMFKRSNSVRSIEIEGDGSNNYTGNFKKDLRTIVHTYIMFSSANRLEQSDVQSIDSNIPKSESNYRKSETIKKIDRIIKRNKNLISYNSSISFDNSGSFGKILNELIKDLCLITSLNSNSFPAGVVSKIVDYVSGLTEELALSARNRFFKAREKKALSDFHILYFACWMLSDIFSEPSSYEPPSEVFDVNKINNQREKQQGPIFTMLLNSIDIEFINDKGSSTLHDNEPVQAVYLNSSKKENVVLIGTYNNIFKSKITNINDFDIFHVSKNRLNSVTMNKIVDILEKNPQLETLFDTKLFDDVKLENSIEALREKAWKDLTKKESKFFDFILFHSSNKIFNFNMYLERDGSKLIVFDIGIKEKFLNSSIKKQLTIIKSEMPKIAKIENSLTYIQVFLSKNRNKSIYRIEDASAYNNMIKTLDKVQDYAANLEWNSLTDDEEKTSFIMVKVFMNICEEISQLAGIASYQ